jgi:glycosyltransferase involved in cell wall biosynthesis
MLESEPSGLHKPLKEVRAQTALSIVIPVYNQESQVSACLDRIKSVVEQISDSFELIVVNDGSIDGTLQALERSRAKDNNSNRIRQISYSQNRGKGYAVRKGVSESRGSVILFTDGDLDVSPHLIGQYVSQLQDHDLVIASKRHKLSKVREPALRRFLSRGFNLLARLVTGIRVSDMQVGMKAGSYDVIKKILQIMRVKRYAFDVELLAIASIMNVSIKEMPVEVSIDRKFKFREILKMFKDVLAIGYRLHIKRWYQKQLLSVQYDGESEERSSITLKHYKKGQLVDVSSASSA